MTLQDRWPLKRVSLIWKLLWKDKNRVTFKYRWLLNRGDCMGRFDCTFFLTYKIFTNTYKNKIWKFLTGLHGFVYATTVYISILIMKFVISILRVWYMQKEWFILFILLWLPIPKSNRTKTSEIFFFILNILCQVYSF